MRMAHLVLLAGALALGTAEAAETAKEAPRHGPGASASSPELANLKIYEERRYRIDMLDCGKEKGVDRRVCERAVHRKAARKSRRRAHDH